MNKAFEILRAKLPSCRPLGKKMSKIESLRFVKAVKKLKAKFKIYNCRMAINYIKYLQSLLYQSSSNEFETNPQHIADEPSYGVEMQCFASAPFAPMDFPHISHFPFSSDSQHA
jgi:hypothetical protein